MIVLLSVSLSPHLVLVALLSMLALTGALVIAAIAAQVARVRTERIRAERWARWEPALLDALVGERDPLSIGLMVYPGERGDFFRLIVALALRLGGSSRLVLAEAASLHTDAASQWLTHRRADRRALAAHLLGLVGNEPERQRLAPMLWDPSLDVAMTVARALSRSASRSHRRLVIDAADRFDAWGPKALASTLSLFGVHGGDDLLLAFRDERHTPFARVAFAEALRRLVYVPAADPVAALLQRPLALEVCAASLRLLRDIGGPDHAEAVRPFCHHESPVLRLHAVSALAALSLDPSDAARIEYALRDESSWVALRAARGLIESGRMASLQAVAAGGAPEAAIARQALVEAGQPLA